MMRTRDDENLFDYSTIVVKSALNNILLYSPSFSRDHQLGRTTFPIFWKRKKKKKRNNLNMMGCQMPMIRWNDYCMVGKIFRLMPVTGQSKCIEDQRFKQIRFLTWRNIFFSRLWFNTRRRFIAITGWTSRPTSWTSLCWWWWRADTNFIMRVAAQ